MQGIEEFAPDFDGVLETAQGRLDELHVRRVAAAELDIAAAQLRGAQQRQR